LLKAYLKHTFVSVPFKFTYNLWWSYQTFDEACSLSNCLWNRCL